MRQYVFILCIVLLCSCDDSSLKFDITALEGDWQTQFKSPAILERWTKDGDKMIGTSFNVLPNEMSVSETLILDEVNGTKVYIPTVVGQNNGLGVAFFCTFENNTRIEFTNQQHDFPQVIRYELVTPDSLNVTIGKYPLGNSSENISFYFSKVKN